MTPRLPRHSLGRLPLFLPILLGWSAGAAQQAPWPPSYEVEVVEEFHITLSDGIRLSGHRFMPRGGRPGERFPVLFHYTPYRETAESREAGAAWFARRGYVDVHVQVRGTGRSEGVLPEREYSEQEIQDALEIIAWLARQPWSNGNIGMYGYSWSGFNAAQVAMRHPPALKAISVGVGTEDLYHENIQYLDGILHFGAYNFGIDVRTTLSPYPDFPLDEEYLRNRFDQAPWSLIFLRHQGDDDAFWRRHTRLDVNPDAIRIPTFMVGGFIDTYRSSIPRMLEQIRAPTAAVVGPWNHGSRYPWPAVEFRHQLLRWWDHWLKGRDTGILREPRLTAYMRHSHPPDPWIREDTIPGEWRADDWPPAGLEQRPLYFRADRTLGATAPVDRSVHDLRYLPTVGPEAGQYWTHTQPDQRPVDAFSLVYESEPLTEELAILGRPRALLHASATAPLAHWFVRLMDVAPDGTTTQITGAGLNGAHRNGSTRPQALEPGRVYPLTLDLHFTSWIFQPGHRIRVAVSNALWPMNWPSPHRMTTSLHLGDPPAGTGGAQASHIQLPVVPARNGRPLPAFTSVPSEIQAVGIDRYGSHPDRWGRRPVKIERNQITARTTVSLEETLPDRRIHITWEVGDHDPAHASVRGGTSMSYFLPGRHLIYEGVTEVRSDLTHFHYLHRRSLTENGRVIRERIWQDTIPRFFR